jgi:hypothetical protein
MIGSVDWFGTVFGAVPDGGIGWNARVARAMVDHGLAVVLIEPGGKVPVCTLSTQAKNKADREAQDKAREAGSPNWEKVRHACGVYHAITDPTAFTRKRVKELLASGCNLAVAPGAGERAIVIIDVDTVEERDGFLEDLSLGLSGLPADPDDAFQLPLTVASPGSRIEGPDGPVWAHKDGGHFWLEVSNSADLPLGTVGKYKDPHGWVAYWGSGYVLVPPSLRAEGAYRVTGQVHQAPGWLLSRLHDAAQAKGKGSGHTWDPDDPIDSWAALTPWEELLIPDGFTPHDHDACGCPTFTRPGSPAHAKSATAHETGCTRFDTSAGHGPLHIWSDSVELNGATPPERTMTKLGYVASARYGGDTSAAMVALELAPALPDSLDLGGSELELEPDPKADAPQDGATPAGESSGDGVFTDPAPAGTDDDDDDDETADDQDSWAFVDLSVYVSGEYVSRAGELMPRSDGTCLLYEGETHSFHGESESGKSLIVLWEAARVMLEGRDVAWIDFDSSAQENVGRLRAFGVPPETIIAHFCYARPESLAKSSSAFSELFKRRYALAVIDGVTDAVALVNGDGDSKGDPNTAFTMFSRRFPRKLAKTGAAVVMIDHVTKDVNNRGRFAIGGQAKMSQITGAAYTVAITRVFGRGMRGEIALRVAKDRPGGVRPWASPQMDRWQTQEVARVVVDDTGDSTRLTFELPGERDLSGLEDPFEPGVERPARNRAQENEDKILAYVIEHPGCSASDLQKVVRSNRGGTEARDALLADEKIVMEEIQGAGNRVTILFYAGPSAIEGGRRELNGRRER